MPVIPAIDLLGGRCVRLVRGDFDHPTVYSEDPYEVVAEFVLAGASLIHVVDLDAARGSAHNRSVIESILRRGDVKVQVAGGVRSAERVDAWLDAGAHAVVMGTAAVHDPGLFERCSHRHPRRMLAALDARNDRAAVSGWTETAPILLGALLGRWDNLPLAGVILTAVDRDGTLSGPDLDTLAKVRAMTSLPLQYSGGVSTLDELRQVAAAGADTVILGKALYEGRITLEEALGE